MEDLRPRSAKTGVLAAAVVISATVLFLAVNLVWVDWQNFNPAVQVPAFLVMTFLFTGLFIVAHEAMHGLVAPGSPALNDWIGRVALFMYAGFSYSALYVTHHQHHKNPASEQDPDFHDGKHPSLFAWYLTFLWRYRSIRPFVFFTVAHFLAVSVLKIPSQNFILGWAIPAVLSSLQLFYFGTYLPHRQPSDGYNSERAVSNEYPEWLSFLTCYHFGYHYEHHVAPYVPWYRLPEARRRLKSGRST